MGPTVDGYVLFSFSGGSEQFYFVSFSYHSVSCFTHVSPATHSFSTLCGLSISD